ncbi:uncharacterized protein LOC113563117 [Ooceraea biroi]|uniref:uncharacterized protein LOC113563117 n=1 Tax=Ooceraea biroi TaxID=2015173 RepID=UPI000F093CDA|nr:uncharacterized protein LOC113563117 [Ooceraea biroi]
MGWFHKSLGPANATLSTALCHPPAILGDGCSTPPTSAMITGTSTTGGWQNRTPSLYARLATTTGVGKEKRRTQETTDPGLLHNSDYCPRLECKRRGSSAMNHNYAAASLPVVKAKGRNEFSWVP